MAILKRKSSKEVQTDSEGVRKFIDLNEFKFQEEKADIRYVARVAEIRRLEDVRKISQYIFEGDILLIDCTAVSAEDYTMKRITEELRRLVRDSNGDVALVGKSFLLVTPPGIAIDRNRIKNL